MAPGATTSKAGGDEARSQTCIRQGWLGKVADLEEDIAAADLHDLATSVEFAWGGGGGGGNFMGMSFLTAVIVASMLWLPWRLWWLVLLPFAHFRFGCFQLLLPDV